MTELEKELERYKKKVAEQGAELDKLTAGLREVARTVDGILIQLVLAKGEELSDHWELAIPRVKVDQLLEKWQLSQETWGDDTFLIIRPRT